MQRRLRLLTAMALAVVLTGLISVPWWPAPRDQQQPSQPTSNGQRNDDCQSCHAAVWHEWQQSHHAISWTSPDVQGAFRHFGHDRKCESCHAPEPVLLTGLLNPVALRTEDRESGVNCLSCHALVDGRVAARRTNDAAPCRPLASSELLSSDHCAGCHVAIFKDWQASRFVAAGKTCQTCHLPSSAGRAGGFSHHCLGGHDDTLVQSAVTMQCEVQQQQLVVSVTNVGAGHNFPGERHNRVLLLEVMERDAAGAIVLGRQHTIKDITPFRGESSAEEIQAGHTVQASFPIIANAATADVRLLFKRFPWIADREALVVKAQEVALP